MCLSYDASYDSSYDECACRMMLHSGFVTLDLTLHYFSSLAAIYSQSCASRASAVCFL